MSYFRKGIAVDRLVGFQDLGSKDDFSTRALENILKMKGIHKKYLSVLDIFFVMTNVLTTKNKL
jgi:hypothetical protein